MRRSLPVRTLATGSECSKGGLANIGPGMILCFRWGLSEKNARLRVLQRQETSLRTLATGSECSKRERRSLPVRTLSILKAAIIHMDDWGALRTLATGSEWGILLKIGTIGVP